MQQISSKLTILVLKLLQTEKKLLSGDRDQVPYLKKSTPFLKLSTLLIMENLPSPTFSVTPPYIVIFPFPCIPITTPLSVAILFYNFRIIINAVDAHISTAITTIFFNCYLAAHGQLWAILKRQPH